RLVSDWSSDVCSSDLACNLLGEPVRVHCQPRQGVELLPRQLHALEPEIRVADADVSCRGHHDDRECHHQLEGTNTTLDAHPTLKIGRASWRERAQREM